MTFQMKQEQLELKTGKRNELNKLHGMITECKHKKMLTYNRIKKDIRWKYHNQHEYSN